MLTAITSGKSGRIRFDGSELSVRWRDAFRRSEDLLTAVFFNRLRYLSDASLARVLGVLIGEEAARELGEFHEIEFWPHLIGLEHRMRVEPDVLLHFGRATLIVEVKPPFGGNQSLGQWQDEVHAFVAECLDGTRTAPETVHFVALGRNTSPSGPQPTSEFDTQGCFRLSVHAQEWEPIIAALPTWKTDCTRVDGAVFADWEQAFQLFGLRPNIRRDWAELMALTTRSPLSLSTLRTWAPAEGKAPLLNQTAVTGKTRSMWHTLLAFTQGHPLELPSWK